MNKVLIVDDNPVNVKVLSSTLAGLGYDLLTVNTGERALNVAERTKPDIILLDVNMPGINGFETCRRLKQNPVTNHIPVIFLTALNEIENKMEGFEAGGVDYVNKPFNNKEVCIRVENHLKISQLTQEVERRNVQLSEAMEELSIIQEQLLDTNQMLIDSIQYSQRIQNALLPGKMNLKEIFPNSFLYFRPKDIVSGDFYYTYQSGNTKIIVVSDCTGHGVPGAFMSVLGINSLIHIIEENNIHSPAKILNSLDKEVIRSLNQQILTDRTIKDGMEVAVISINTDSRELTYSTAHRPIFKLSGNELTVLKQNSTSIGFDIYRSKPSYEEVTISFREDDKFYLFTDGITDQFGGEIGRKYTPKRLREFLVSTSNLSMEDQFYRFVNEFKSWQGSISSTDDVTLFGFSVN